MVHKIRIIFLFIVFILMCAIGFTHKGHIETNLLKTLLPDKVTNSADIVSIANKSSSIIKVVFESDTQDNLEELKQNFNNKINTEYFEINKPDISKLLDKYLSQPANFLSEKTIKLLTEKKYDEIYSKSIENLYNPTGIQLTTLDKDPFLLLDDFILSNKKISNNTDYMNGKYYDFMTLKSKNNDALSPDLSNKKIEQLVNIQKNLSDKHSKIYLGGTPIHSYYTSLRSVTDINIICILSTLIIIFLTYIYFKNLKLLLPIALSIIFGMLFGYIATRLWFDDFQVITMVFSTTLIGIGIDYSYHYFFAEQIDKDFIKNLSFSLLTTVIPFTLLYLTGIELLEQVAVFTIFGLLGIYLIVMFIYPCFESSSPVKIYKPQYNLYKICLIVIFILSITGLARFRFNDSLASLYNPTKILLNAETLYNKVSGENTNTQIITVKGDNINQIIETEERITKQLNHDNIEYIALSKIFPSEKKQYENFNLVKDLYNNNLNKYSDILSANQIQELKNTKFFPVTFDNLYLKDFMLNSNTSTIFVFDDKKLNLTEKNTNVINLQSDIRRYMRYYRHILLILFPIVILLLYGLLTFLYDYKKAYRILLPSLTGIASAILVTALIYGELNLFSIITIFLVLGFTIDYSIFRINPKKNTESAIFVSCVTTSFSFLLLALCGFKMLSSMASVLFVGIITSYLAGYFLLKNYRKDFFLKQENNKSAKWFQVKEQSAGEKRLQLTWFLYKIFGKKVLYLIAALVAFFTFIFAPKIRTYSKKYFLIISKYTDIKPSLINQFKHILSYANSLADKILVCNRDFNPSSIIFKNTDLKEQLYNDIENGNGVFLICDHIGNIEVLQALFSEDIGLKFNVNMFMSNQQSRIFNGFLKKIKNEYPVNIFQVEDIGLNTGIELKESLNKGDIVFIAGDRVAQNNDDKNIEKELFEHKIYLPKGTFKLAKLMEVPTYFISAVKIDNQYQIILEKQSNLTEKELVSSYTKYLERVIKINPFQFFHFYDFFN